MFNIDDLPDDVYEAITGRKREMLDPEALDSLSSICDNHIVANTSSKQDVSNALLLLRSKGYRVFKPTGKRKKRK